MPRGCDQCEALMINGVFCHETGCPNSKKTWVEERQEWVRFVDCQNCGAEVEQGDTCRCDLDEEPESQSSKHCDAGWMNDTRFGD